MEAKEQKAKEEAKKALGVIKEEAKVPKAKKVSKVKGKGTTEKSSAKGDQQTLVVSVGQAVQNQPPANDQAAAATNKQKTSEPASQQVSDSADKVTGESTNQNISESETSKKSDLTADIPTSDTSQNDASKPDSGEKA